MVRVVLPALVAVPLAVATSTAMLAWPARSPAADAAPQSPGQYEPMRSLAPLVDAVMPAVVSIEVEEEVVGGADMPPWMREFLGAPPDGGAQQGAGSGFIVSPEGLVLTNHHVIAHSKKLKVRFDDGTYVNAVLLGSDPDLDVALLQLPQNRVWPYVELGDSQHLRVGDWVVAVGNSLGLGPTVTTGIISAKGRASEFSLWQEFLQTDAAINPGNSGGPLFDLDGNVVGINTAIIAGANTVGFSVPIDLVKRSVDDLKTHGKIVRGFMGVTTEALTAARAQELGVDLAKGALVTEVHAGTPAATAGLQPFDIIVGIADVDVVDNIGLTRVIAVHKPGETVGIDILREGEPMTLSATLVDRDEWIADQPKR